MKPFILEGVKITAGIEAALQEAHRRTVSFALRDGKAVSEAWLGLGSPSVYRDAVRAGVMTPACGAEEPRILNWYKLTPKGVSVFAAWLARKVNV